MKLKQYFSLIIIFSFLLSSFTFYGSSEAFICSNKFTNEAFAQENNETTEEDNNNNADKNNDKVGEANNEGEDQGGALIMYIVLAVLLIGSFLIRLIYYNSKR